VSGKGRRRRPGPMTSDHYFQRFGFCERQIPTPPRDDLGIVIVIPCFNEPDLNGSLESLWACERPDGAVEIIVVINSSAGGAAELRRQNELTLAQASQWVAQHADARFAVHLLHFPDLPPKHAGVGLARKIGMDEAVRRFDGVGRTQRGVIVGFDADCRCAQNFLPSIERYFRHHPHSPGCSIYFEHPLDGPLDPPVLEAIISYELHLRYYVRALRYAGFPYAYHTIGSCMAVRAEAYLKQGGMNKRKAGEDFYFLHKIIPLGGFADLVETAVFPSPRPSDRVPFGTGKAVQDYLDRREAVTDPLQAFLDLKAFFDDLSSLHQRDDFLLGHWPGAWPESVRTFLDVQRFSEALREMRENTSTEAAFQKRFFNWFNGFRVMKFINRARARYYGSGKVIEEAAKLLALMSKASGHCGDLSMRELLERYRTLDRAAKDVS
jgi:hypothetical protein